MAGIADSNAWGGGEVLHHHRIISAILQGQLSDPAKDHLCWLDLACGCGRAFNGIAHMEDEARRKLRYFGYELSNAYARETEQFAESLGIDCKVYVGDLVHYTKYYDLDSRFQLITLTNTVHEVHPMLLPSIIMTALARLEPAGCLYVYDMEEIRPPELGAIPWTQVDACRILDCLFSALGVDKRRRPFVTPWKHRTCDGWDFQINRSHLALSDDELAARQEPVVRDTAESIRTMLSIKRAQLREQLETLTRFGCNPPPATEDDEKRYLDRKHRLLFDYWAIERSLSAPLPEVAWDSKPNTLTGSSVGEAV